MKICILTETYYPVVGGGETQARLLAEGLTAKGHSVLILTRRSDASLVKHEMFGDIDVYRLTPVGRGQLKKWGLLISSIPSLIRLRNRYDLIFVSGYRIIGLAAVIVGKFVGKAVILKADSQGEMSGEFFTGGLKIFHISPEAFLFKLFLGFRNYILKKADAFSAISEDVASEWIGNGVPSNRIHLITNCVDTYRFTVVEPAKKYSLREKLNLPRDAFIATYTGRLVTYKGLPLLLQVWNEFRKSEKDVVLVLAGTGGLDIHNCESDLHEFVASNRMEQQVVFTGAIQNVADYLQASDIFVFPTENDAFPSSIVEAMACGLPVISTPVGAIKTILAHKQNGLLIQPGNHEQLFNALHVLKSDGELAARLGQAARRTAWSHYSAERVTEQYISLFRSTLEAG